MREEHHPRDDLRTLPHKNKIRCKQVLPVCSKCQYPGPESHHKRKRLEILEIENLK